MKCCICGMPYEEHDRVIRYFSMVDTESFEIKTIDRLNIQGRTTSLCPNCMKAAMFGIVLTKKYKKYEPYKPLLFAPMFEDEQTVSTSV